MKNNSAGLTLVEFVLVFPLVFFLALGSLEIARLYAFKVYLQAITNDTAIMLSHSHLQILNKNETEKNNLLYRVKKDIEKKIQQFPTEFVFFQGENIEKMENNSIQMSLNFENYSKKNHPNGVYLKVNTCLPVLFSHVLNGLFDESVFIGKKTNSSNDASRNCLGHFLKFQHSYPYINFRVRSASYFPWPASTNIFIKGFHIPKKIKGLEFIDDKQKSNLFNQNISSEL